MIKTSLIKIDTNGCVVLSDEQLIAIENQAGQYLSGGNNNRGCKGTTNEVCTNTGCEGNTNGTCVNRGLLCKDLNVYNPT